jgi:hypothetical protein
VDVGSSSPYSDHSLAANVWQSDQPFASGSYGFVQGGQVYHAQDGVSGTNDPGLYQSYRSGTQLEYKVTLPAGNYQVTLLFSDFTSTSTGQNEFSTTVQGQLVSSGLDLFSAVGSAYAYNLTFDATVDASGLLDIVVAASSGQAVLSAIQVIGLQQANPLTIQLDEPSNAVLQP